MLRRRYQALPLFAAGALVLAACGASDDERAAEAAAAGASYVPVTIQLQWTAQAQFAGYYAAAAQGYYEDEGLAVELAEWSDADGIQPQIYAATGAADYAVAWVPKALESREAKGAELTNVAQIFQRSPLRQVAWADSGIETVEDLEGKTIGSWGFGNEHEMEAGLRSAGLDPATDVTIETQAFDMQALLSRQIDAAQAQTYNEYAQLLEAVNPATGELYTAEDFVVIDWNQVGTAMLQDGLWANSGRLADDDEYVETTEKVVKATLKGWIYCRDNPDDCVQYVLDSGPALGTSHQTWQMAEVNKLIWPSPNKVGMVDAALWDQTVAVATAQAIITAPPTDAYTTQFVEAALADLEAEGLDVVGEGYTAPAVELAEGGQ